MTKNILRNQKLPTHTSLPLHIRTQYSSDVQAVLIEMRIFGKFGEFREFNAYPGFRNVHIMPPKTTIIYIHNHS
jgi:hypothetical protein